MMYSHHPKPSSFLKVVPPSHSLETLAPRPRMQRVGISHTLQMAGRRRSALTGVLFAHSVAHRL